MSETEREPELEIKEEKDEELERAKDSFAVVFDNHKDGEERVRVITDRLGKILDSDDFDGEEVRKSLQTCSKTEDKKEFVDGVMLALQPVLTFRKNNPQAFEKLAREVAMSQEGMKPLNEIMYYGGRDDYIHIHLANARDLKNLRALVLDGLQKLAEVIKNNEKVKTIEATSWIVAKNPGLMEKMGFEVEGEIDEEFRRRHFSDDKRKISKATIGREEFLKRYLKE